MKRRQWTILWVGALVLFILFLIKGLVVPITMMVTGLVLAAASGLIFDKREDDINID